MNEIYGEKVNILGAFHRFNLGSQQEPKKYRQHSFKCFTYVFNYIKIRFKYKLAEDYF